MKTTLLLITIIWGLNISAQDKITTKDKKELNVKILEKTDKLVKYKMPDYIDGVTMTMRTKRIEKIVFANGHTDLVGNNNPRRKKPISINTGISYIISEAEGGYFNLKLDYFIIPQIQFELAFKSEFEDEAIFMFGTKFHLNTNWSTNKFTPYVGISFEPVGRFIEMPIGVNFISNVGFTTSLSLNPSYYQWNGSYYYYMFAELSIGWAF